MVPRSPIAAALVCVVLTAGSSFAQSPPRPAVVWPLDRTAYFVGEQVPLAIGGVPENETCRLEAVNADGRTLLYQGPARVLRWDTTRWAPGDYQLEINQHATGQRVTLTGVLRRSAGSMQDETLPPDPQFNPQQRYTADERATLSAAHWDQVVSVLKDAGVTALFPMAQSDAGRFESLDALARAGTLLLVNPDTRPTSFFPVGNHPDELDGMSQRLILTAQANGRYPNFAGFSFGWDTTGYALGGRRGLLTYWGWGDKTQALRKYLDRIDRHTGAEFTRRSGLAPVTEAEYIAYLLSIQRPEFAPAIDLPTRRWLEEIARHTRPLEERQRTAFERRLDAWSAYLMGLYQEAYGTLAANVRAVDPALRYTASVQVDHTAVRFGQYFPSAYTPLDLQYQSTWNDQIGGPDYAYQWLFTAGLLNMHRGDKPTWLSNTFGAVHDRARVPGKFVRVAAHGLPWGVSGIGFALEGFSNLLGGMNQHSRWAAIQGQAGEADVRAGREFLDRFACLALEGRGDHGVGVLFSKSQFQRQHVVMGFGATCYQAFLVLTRLGYTPRLMTEEDLVAGRASGLRSLVVVGQTVPLPPEVTAAIAALAQGGSRVLVDDSTTVTVPAVKKLGYAFPFAQLGKPHNWQAPNMPAGDNDALLAARWYADLGPRFAGALGDGGRGLLVAEQGAATNVTLLHIDGGPDAKYVVAVNDSHIQTQADWHQVQETLVPVSAPAAPPAPAAPAAAPAQPASYVFDCTAEQPIGRLGPLACDLRQTTARVFAVLPRELKRIDLAATQSLTAGEPLVVAVRFRDASDQPLAAVLPFHLSIRRPDGRVAQEFYRSTDRQGAFTLAVPLGANAPPGAWSVLVRAQLTGDTARLPVQVAAAAPQLSAQPWAEPVIVRQRGALDQALARGTRFVLPLFDAGTHPQLVPVAEKVQQVLAARGVEVEIRRRPEIGTYTLAYELTAPQQHENARAERGELFGRIKRETVNANDWYSALSGWRFGRPVILLDLASQTGDNPLAESLMAPPHGRRADLLWPEVSEAFPGPGRAVVQAVPWAFAPRTPAVVVQAMDVAGLLAGAAALANLPADRLTPAIEATRAALWREYHVGGRPARPAAAKLTAIGLQTGRAPQPFVLRFPGDRPLPADQVRRPERPLPAAVAVPGTIEPAQCVLLLRRTIDGRETWIETATAAPLVPDLRFSDALLLVLDVKQAGKRHIVAEGIFRYSDRKPCWQAQWEDIIELREKLVPRQRQPLVFDLQRRDGQPVGQLVPVRTEQKEVPLEMAAASAGLKPKTVVEEVVTHVAGDIDLPAGRQELVLIPRHVVDGKLVKIEFQP